MSRRSSGIRQPEEVLLSGKQIREAVASCREALHAVGVDLDAALLEAMATYIELLLRWNRKINLTAITNPVEIASRNFAESFFAARWLSPHVGHLCDIGSGAGFPGLALKLVLPRLSVMLLEPTAKKAAFLAEVGRTLSLTQVQVLRARWQESKIPLGTLDAITARALGGYEALAAWADSKLKSDGKLLLWLGARDALQLSQLPGWRWQTETVPTTRGRVLLIGSPS